MEYEQLKTKWKEILEQELLARLERSEEGGGRMLRLSYMPGSLAVVELWEDKGPPGYLLVTAEACLAALDDGKFELDPIPVVLEVHVDEGGELGPIQLPPLDLAGTGEFEGCPSTG